MLSKSNSGSGSGGQIDQVGILNSFHKNWTQGRVHEVKWTKLAWSIGSAKNRLLERVHEVKWTKFTSSISPTKVVLQNVFMKSNEPNSRVLLPAFYHPFVARRRLLKQLTSWQNIILPAESSSSLYQQIARSPYPAAYLLLRSYNRLWVLAWLRMKSLVLIKEEDGAAASFEQHLVEVWRKYHPLLHDFGQNVNKPVRQSSASWEACTPHGKLKLQVE